MEIGESNKDNTEAVLEVLEGGGTLDVAPIAGGMILLDKEGKKSKTQPNVKTFLELQNKEKIEHTGTMRQGHFLFRGKVDSYKSPKEE